MGIFEAVVEGDTAYVKQLLDRREVAVNARQPETEKTLLMLAVENGQLDMVRLLINEGAGVDYVDLHDKTVLHYVKNAKPKNPELVAIIQQYISKDLIKILRSDLNMDEKILWVNLWLDEGLSFNYTIFVNLLWAKIPEALIMTLINRANIVADDLISELFSYTFVTAYSSECKIAIIKLLLKNGMDINSSISRNDGYGYPNNPLDLAMRTRNFTKKTSLELSKFLLDNGANPNISGYDRLPLMTYCDDLDKTKLLLAAGADPLLVTDKKIWLGSGSKKCNSLDYASVCMRYDDYNRSKYQPTVKLMAQAAALKLYADSGPIALAVAQGQLEHIKMLTDISSLKLQDRSDADCHELEESVNKALEVDEFLHKYESNESQITTLLKVLQAALLERLSEKEAPKGFLSWLTGSKGYKPLSDTADTDDINDRRTLDEAKKNPRKPT